MTRLRYFLEKTYESAKLSICKYLLYEINSAFEKKFKYAIVKIENDTTSDNDIIYI